MTLQETRSGYPHPLTTASDLRRAAELVLAHGFTRRNYVGAGHTLCADGAIRLSVGDIKLVFDAAQPGHRYDDTGISSMSTLYRRQAAISALAPLAPIEGCTGKCNFDHSILPEPFYVDYRVYHYNDFICEGGPALASLLIRAATRLEETHTAQTIPFPRQPQPQPQPQQEAS